MRAILVASGSGVGEPQLEQKRTPGVTYDPQLEQCIGFYLSFAPSDQFDGAIIPKETDALEIQNEAEPG